MLMTVPWAWLKSGMKRDGIVAAEGSSSDGNDADGGGGDRRCCWRSVLHWSSVCGNNTLMEMTTTVMQVAAP